MQPVTFRGHSLSLFVSTACLGTLAVVLAASVIASRISSGSSSKSLGDWVIEGTVAVIFLLGSGLGIWMVVRAWTARLTLSEDTLEARQVFSTKVIVRRDILAAGVVEGGGFTPSASVRLQLADGTVERIQMPGRYITNAGAAELACAIQDWASTA